jgi:hypothetical protein
MVQGKLRRYLGLFGTPGVLWGMEVSEDIAVAEVGGGADKP